MHSVHTSCIPQYLYEEANQSAASVYIVMTRNRFFVNNSSNPELIQTKFYTVTGAQMGHFPGNFGCPRLRAIKMAQKNHFFVRDTTTPKCHFSAAVLREHFETTRESMWSFINPFQKKNCNIFRKGVIYPKTKLFEVCFSGCRYQPTDKMIIF